ncbi:RAP domain-containing protein [Thalassotalea sp. G20_0]|uniref:RAP domain-containing protein n=1 Tax=Thalassotalea sp. G20_0 TaxID=2821093 RepID=UPI001ADC808D|nr:RAP domain-containing protein [Thalassotalea sp. G20_0]MBO9496083.1 RAP domain-containing protein [Thalassotalea sp. G20_0]
MDRGSAGISDKYARSDNDYNQPNDHAVSSKRGRYGHCSVRQWHNPPRTNPERNEFYRSSDACPSQHLQCRSVNPAQDFNALIKPEIMDDLVNKSYRFGHRYDGRNHGQYASSIKKYTLAAKRPLNRTEQSQLIHLLQNFTATRSWNWRSLTATLHSLTSAGVFTPHNPMDQSVKLTQAALLSTLLDAIIFNCNQKPQAMDIEALAIANLLWAMAKLVGNGLERTPGLKEAVAALLPLVSAHKDQFIPQNITNLLWAMAKLDELVELNVVTSTFESLVYKISEIPQLSQQGILISLWGVMVCCARLSMVSNANKNNVLEKHIVDLFTHLEKSSPDNEEEQTIIAMAASWLGRTSPVVPHYQTLISKHQSDFRDQLKSCIPSLQIEEEKSLNSLPPVDLILPDHNMVIEIQGKFHYVSGDFKTRNGSTLLKIALLQKAGFEVIEIPVNQLCNPDLIIDHIKTRVDIPPQGHGSASVKIGCVDETNVAADKECQSSDQRYLAAEEHLEQQTDKPKNRKKKRKKIHKHFSKMNF